MISINIQRAGWGRGVFGAALRRVEVKSTGVMPAVQGVVGSGEIVSLRDG